MFRAAEIASAKAVRRTRPSLVRGRWNRENTGRKAYMKWAGGCSKQGTDRRFGLNLREMRASKGSKQEET